MLDRQIRSHFNTSHVTVYRKRLFPFCIPWDNFNTSHVTVYLIISTARRETDLNFNTSHVTVYQNVAWWFCLGSWISIHLMLRFIPDDAQAYKNVWAFQYISCYGLSFSPYNEILIGFRFQYISCYGLSYRTGADHKNMCDFNTSHVTVYQFKVICKEENRSNFNTSHVTVYLDAP